MGLKRLFSKVGQVQCGDAEQEGELQETLSKQREVAEQQGTLAQQALLSPDWVSW